MLDLLEFGTHELMNGLAEQELSGDVIGAAIAVHRKLGPGYLESFYEEALCIELERQGIIFETQKCVSIFYRDRKIGEHRLDMLVGGKLVVELKTVKAIEDIHFVIVRSYMKAVNVEAGLILNFAAMPLTIKRVGREYQSNSETQYNT
jgi:GxxExxY protein